MSPFHLNKIRQVIITKTPISLLIIYEHIASILSLLSLEKHESYYLYLFIQNNHLFITICLGEKFLGLVRGLPLPTNAG